MQIKAKETDADISRSSISFNYVNELEQLESYHEASYAKLSTEDTLHFMRYGSKPLESDKLKSSYVLPTRYFNNTRSQKASYIGRRYNEVADKTPKTHRREGSNTASTPHESERLSELRKSTNISIRKTIDEIERQLINRKSITPNKSIIDINERAVLNINASFMDTDGAEDRATDNFESPKSMFTDLKGFESFRKDSDDCVKLGTDFRSPMFGFSKKFVFSDYKIARQDSLSIAAEHMRSPWSIENVSSLPRTTTTTTASGSTPGRPSETSSSQ